MTYLIIGNNSKNINDKVVSIISTLWKRGIEEDILNLNIPDIHRIESSNINSIGIEDVKKLQKEMVYTPYTELVQVALVVDADRLTTQAQNSFLKTLEESSSTTAYILTTTNERKLLPTILSRSMKIYTKQVKSERGGGVPNILEMDLIEAFSSIEKISKDMDNSKEFLDQIESYYQNLFEDALKSNEQSQKIYDNIQRISETKKRVQANGNRRLLLENLFLVLTR